MVILSALTVLALMNFESEVVPNKLRSADDWIVIEERRREKMEIERE